MKFITIPNVLKKNKPEELVIVVSDAKLGSDTCRDMFVRDIRRYVLLITNTEKLS